MNDFTPKNDIEKDLWALVRAHGHPKQGDGTLSEEEYANYLAAIPQGALMLVDLGEGMTYVSYSDLDRMSSVESIDMATKVQVHKGYHKDNKGHRMSLDEIKKKLQRAGEPTDEDGNVLPLNSQRHYEKIKGRTIGLSEQQHQRGEKSTEGNAESNEAGKEAGAMIEAVINKLAEDLEAGMITEEEHALYTSMAEDGVLILNGASDYTFLQEPEDYEAQNKLGIEATISRSVDIEDGDAPVESGVLMGQNDPVVARPDESNEGNTRKETPAADTGKKPINPTQGSLGIPPNGDVPHSAAGAGSVQPIVPGQVGNPNASLQKPTVGLPKQFQSQTKRIGPVQGDITSVTKGRKQPAQAPASRAHETNEGNAEAKADGEVTITETSSDDDIVTRDWQRYQDAVQQNEQIRHEQMAQVQNQRYRDNQRRNQKKKGGLPVGKIAFGAGSIAGIPIVGSAGLAALIHDSASATPEITSQLWPWLEWLPHLPVTPFWA